MVKESGRLRTAELDCWVRVSGILYKASDLRIVQVFKRAMKGALWPLRMGSQGHSWMLSWIPSPFLVLVMELALMQWTKQSGPGDPPRDTHQWGLGR